MPGDNTVVVFFSRNARSEVKSKILDKNLPYVDNYKLISAVHTHALSKIKQSGLPYIVFDENRQSGNCFGEKIHHAVHECAELGYTNFIIIGNDCPDLTSEDIIRTAKMIENGVTILGPDKRGGLYLIGISKISLNQIDLRTLPWSAATLQSTFIGILKTLSLETHCLEQKSDLNNSKDFQHIYNSRILTLFRNLRESVFYYSDDFSPNSELLLSAILAHGFKLRGPPFC